MDTKDQTIYTLSRKIRISKDAIDMFLRQATDEQKEGYLLLLQAETQKRTDNRKSRLLKYSRLPQIKTFESFDFKDIDFADTYSKQDLMALEFLDNHEGFVFLGQTGRGKTHLALAVAYACIQKLKKVYFTTAAQLVLDLSQAHDKGQSARLLKELKSLDLLVIDEMGYVPISQEGSRLLFQVIADAYEKQSLIITTNIEFSHWGYIFGDDKLAAAVIDRIIHHNRLVNFRGTSRRLEESLMLGSNTQ